jgi:hypothetical protein
VGKQRADGDLLGRYRDVDAARFYKVDERRPVY